MGILSGQPQHEPMHYGEVFGTWSFLSAAKGTVAGHQTWLNHTGDGDLHKLLEETIQLAQQEIKQIEELLKENGVGLPPSPPERPKATLEDIPCWRSVPRPRDRCCCVKRNCGQLNLL